MARLFTNQECGRLHANCFLGARLLLLALLDGVNALLDFCDRWLALRLLVAPLAMAVAAATTAPAAAMLLALGLRDRLLRRLLGVALLLRTAVWTRRARIRPTLAARLRGSPALPVARRIPVLPVAASFEPPLLLAIAAAAVLVAASVATAVPAPAALETLVAATLLVAAWLALGGL